MRCELNTSTWCILRCSGQNTLPLLMSLTKAGFEMWTPVEVRKRRVPQANVKRRIERPMMPGYLFARADGLLDLIHLSNAPGLEHRDFRVFRQQDRFPLIADEILAPVRLMERKTKVEPQGLASGDRVRLTDGAYAGLRGEVVEGGAKFARVRIPGFHSPLKVAAFYLLRDDSSSAKLRAA